MNENFYSIILSNKFDGCKIVQDGLDTIYSKKLIIELFKKDILREFWDEIDLYPSSEVDKLARSYFKTLELSLKIEREMYGFAPYIGR
ncbi:hypothetical protein L1282_000048 [Chryseobacterium sp. HSC-36S06]|nr:hypothetical protein [Chryseobacterium sp. HSC-36S06]